MPGYRQTKSLVLPQRRINVAGIPLLALGSVRKRNYVNRRWKKITRK
jgi:hypothetical protein